jgi:outer membrane protein assembly factor BamB
MLVLLSMPHVAYTANWSGWRGPNRNGHSDETGLPATWSPSSIQWKTPLKGSGQSSPVIWEDRIFLTSAIDKGKQRLVICLDRQTGKLQWEQVAWEGVPEPSHRMNGWASSTCTTDGTHVYASFGRGGLHCYTVAGQHVWSQDLGALEGPWGTAACPLLVGNLLIQNCDADVEAYLIAVNKLTGQTVWKVPRPNHRGWSSPILVDTGKRQEVVVNGHEGVVAYAPQTGKTLWSCRCPRGRGTPTVTPAGGVIYALNGLGGGGAYAIRTGGSGDVTDQQRLWITERRTRDLPSPIIIGQTMLVMSLRGSILSGYDTRTGQELWKERIGGQVSASPVAYGGLAFFIDEAGETIVVDPTGPKHILRRNTLGGGTDEIFRASITPFQGRAFLRSDRMLYCVGQPDGSPRRGLSGIQSK